jgi:hypothetical protein
VKIDINKNERQYQLANFSDIEVVKGLVLLRNRLDKYYRKEPVYPIEAGGYQELNQELIVLYADLDSLIERARLSKPQRTLIKLMQNGMTVEDIEFYIGTPAADVMKAVNLICRRLVEQNNEDWLVWANLNYISTEWKTCTKCGESLPATEIFFFKGDAYKDGIRSECRKCARSSANQ